ncbi:MAG: hypothetical protein KDE09_26480, partial [Anaerolineales bacterium]|nr:hypothetical protein [Anaerolineales bacterium]
TLVYRDETSGTWVDTHPCNGCTLNIDTNELLTWLDHATEFAVTGRLADGTRIFLPIITRP